MKNKSMIAICCIFILLTMTGCQLAQESAGTGAYEDRLVGVFVTTDYLDLFDFDSYLNDNLKGFSGGEIVVDGGTEKYQGRLYATLTTRTLTSEETGETMETDEYVFKDIEGIPFFSVTVPASEGHDSYKTSISDPAISEGHTAIFVGDTENKTTLEGTIYVSPARKECTCYFNPVYQSADGSVYLTSGSGFMIGDWTVVEGEQFSQTMDASYSVTENGETKTESISIKMSVSVMFTPEKIVILQMDEDSKLISRVEYTPGELPDTLAPEADAAYLIVETHKRDVESESGIMLTRDIYGYEAESVETYSTGEDGVCIKHWTQIIWR